MVELTSEQFAQRAFEFNLVDERQLESVWSEFGTHSVPVQELRNFLVRRGLLTNFQIERIFKGERTGYFYGDYKVLYLVGTGSFARVFRAVHKATAKVVAVKVLRRRFADAPQTREQFLREGELGATLRHPNIVPIFEVYSQGPTSYLVMDFVEGQSLKDFTRVRKKLDAAEATKLITDVVSGLAYASSKGITHRDLKMSNVLVSSSGRAMLVDFGLAAFSAKLNDEAIANCPNPRTIDYAALERATGVRKDDPRSDIYFTGCLFYHMLTGRPPLYESKDRLQRLSIQRFQEIPPLLSLDATIPHVAALVVNKSMELNPERRYQSQEEFLADLKLLAKRLADGDLGTSDAPEASTEFTFNPLGKAQKSHDGEGQTIMVVETHVELQNALREGLKKHGYRVLVIGDPARALSRFQEGEKGANCVVFSAVQLGESALKAYKEFCAFTRTKDVPALLLLDEHQAGWASEVPADSRHAALSMPIKMGALRSAIKRVLA